jgi:hypothetical protein
VGWCGAIFLARIVNNQTPLQQQQQQWTVLAAMWGVPSLMTGILIKIDIYSYLHVMIGREAESIIDLNL